MMKIAPNHKAPGVIPGGTVDSLAQNQLLAAVPAAVYERLQPYLESVPLAFGKVIYGAD